MVDMGLGELSPSPPPLPPPPLRCNYGGQFCRSSLESSSNDGFDDSDDSSDEDSSDSESDIVKPRRRPSSRAEVETKRRSAVNSRGGHGEMTCGIAGGEG